MNEVGALGTKAICEALMINPTLTNLNLEGKEGKEEKGDLL